MNAFIHDVRIAARSLKNEIRFSAVCILALALGIGVSAAMFSVIYNGVLNPLPYKAASRLVFFSVHSLDHPNSTNRRYFSLDEFADYQQKNSIFEGMIGLNQVSVLMNKAEGVQRVAAVELSDDAFVFLGVQPLLGQIPMTHGDGLDATSIAILNFRFWKDEFGGDPAILGTNLVMNGRSRTVVAIMPLRFQLGGGDIWLPARLTRTQTNVAEQQAGSEAPDRSILCIGRLKAGITPNAGATNLQAIAQQIAKAHPADYPGHFAISISRMTDDLVGDFGAALRLLIAAVLLVLLISCVTVANLFLVRGLKRLGDMSVRISLGATRFHLVRHAWAEGFLVGLLGWMIGCVVAYGCVTWIVLARPAHKWFPDEAVIRMNLPVLCFAFAAAMITATVFSISPILYKWRVYARSGSVQHDNQALPRSSQNVVRSGFVILQIGLSIALVFGAGLMLRSLIAITHVDLGFDAKNIVVLAVKTPKDRYKSSQQKRIYFEEVLGRIAALPTVVAVGETTHLPLYSGLSTQVVSLGSPSTQQIHAQLDLCSAGMFDALGLRLQKGRIFSRVDSDSQSVVAVVNEKLARDLFGRVDPIGQRLQVRILAQIPDVPRGASFEIVGVVSDAKNNWPTNPTDPEIYIPYTITGAGDRAIIVRTNVNPAVVIPAIREQIQSVDRGVALMNVRTLASYLHELSYVLPEFEAGAFGAFAAVGFMLSLIGIFGIISYDVSLRTKEIGIRMALGARPNQVFGMVLRKGLVLITIGLCVGYFLSLGISRFVASQIWGVRAHDPWTYVFVALAAIASGLIATFFPARRATRIEPLAALRNL